MSVKDRKFWTEFLRLYQSMPCLWRVKGEDYYNRGLKAASYNKLIKKLREFDKDATRETVVRKINNFRTNYRRDLRKSMKQSPEAPFQSTLWYFDLLKFLEDQENTNESSSNIDIKYESQNSMNGYASENSIVSSAPSSPWQSPPPPSRSPSPTTTTLPQPAAPPLKKKKLNHNVELQSLEFVSEEPIKDDSDAIDILGKGWASQYAELTNSQKIFARTIFADILYHGCLSYLTEEKVEDVHHVLKGTLSKPKNR